MEHHVITICNWLRGAVKNDSYFQFHGKKWQSRFPEVGIDPALIHPPLGAAYKLRSHHSGDIGQSPKKEGAHLLGGLSLYAEYIRGFLGDFLGALKVSEAQRSRRTQYRFWGNSCYRELSSSN